MNNTKIEWCDGTWNPVTGCMQGCSYCYAERIAHRFACGLSISDNDKLHVLTEPVIYHEWNECDESNKSRRNIYPFGFEPTYHRYRLKELLEAKKPQNIFVCSMADLFGDWVPDKWIQEILAVCHMAKRNNYLFLTKNPSRYAKVTQPMDYADNMWYGTTITNNKEMDDRLTQLFCFKISSRSKIFISLEPLHEEISEKHLDKIRHVDWAIIGAESGNRKGKILPEKDWILRIVDACNRYGVPVFMKDSLIKIVGEQNMIREFPEFSICSMKIGGQNGKG